MKSALQKWRELRSFTIHQLATESGVSQRVIERAEKFRSLPTSTDKGRLAISLQVSVFTIFPKSESKRFSDQARRLTEYSSASQWT